MTDTSSLGTYLDTSVVVAALLPAIPNHRACAAFCAALEASRTRVFLSQITRFEVAQSWFRLPTMPYIDAETRRTYRLGAWDRNTLVREHWMVDGASRLETQLARYQEVVELPLDRDIWLASLELMARHRLRSHDAAHAATAVSLGVVDFASVDDDFRRLPNLRLQLVRDAPSSPAL
jgi:predicted nucleic acid-binding protein